MRIRERVVKNVTILELEGKMILGDGDVQLVRKVEELVEKGSKAILLSLPKMAYTDSGGLGALVASFTTLARAGGRLKLLDPTKKVKDLLTITKLITVYEVFDNEEEAIASFEVHR